MVGTKGKAFNVERLLKRISKLEKELREETEGRMYLQKNQDERDGILIHQFQQENDELVAKHDAELMKLHYEN